MTNDRMPRKVEDIEILRAANQMIKLYPEEPELAACLRADAAYEQGDMFNFELWRKISKAVCQLIRQTPSSQRDVN
jgi:hypothetical protein